MTPAIYRFESKVELLDYGRMAYRIAKLPPAVVRQLPLADQPRLRFVGQINGHPHKGAILPAGDGSHYIILSRQTLKACHAVEGDRIMVEFQLDAPDSVDVPAELQAALERNRCAQDAWNELTPGKRRGFAHMVNSAKLPATKRKRVEEIVDQLLDRQ